MTLSDIAPTFATRRIFMGCGEFVTCLKNDLYSTKGGVSEVQASWLPFPVEDAEPARLRRLATGGLDHGDGMPSV